MALSVLVIWVYFPAIIKGLEAHIIESRIGPLEARYKAASLGFYENREEESAAEMALLLTEMAAVRKGERGAPLKYRAFIALTESLGRQNRVVESLAVYDRWLAFDNRDLRAHTGKANTLLKIPERRDEGVQILSDLYQLAPNVPIIADAYGEILFEAGDILAFFVNFQRKYAAFRIEASKGDWYFYWDTGSGLSGKQSAKARTEWVSAFEIQVRHPLRAATFTQLRLDSPPKLPIWIEAGRFRIERSQGPSSEFLLTDCKVAMHDMVRNQDLIFATGMDPFFEARLAEPLVVDSDFDLVFQARLFPVNYEKLVSYLRDPEKRQLLAAQLNERSLLHGQEFLSALCGFLDGEG